MPIEKFDGFYRFLSNFWEVSVMFDEELYPSAEHAFQAAKSLDPAVREKIRAAKDPAEAKRLGRKVHPIRSDWEDIKLQVMYDIVKDKFERHHMLAHELIETGNDFLVEGNWWNDRYWGVCRGVGENHLGKILMRVRGELWQALREKGE